MVNLKLESVNISAGLNISAEQTENISISDGKEIYKEQVGGTCDYEKLENLPELDGRTIIGNINEEDPTVHAITLAELAELFN